MTDRPLRCVQCGAVWRSAPAAQVAAARGGCLRCGGELVELAEAEPDEDEPGDGGVSRSS
jgi:predicted  nucleic acid-binding Zn-ribbon protein